MSPYPVARCSLQQVQEQNVEVDWFFVVEQPIVYRCPRGGVSWCLRYASSNAQGC